MKSPLTGKEMSKVKRQDEITVCGMKVLSDMEYWLCEDTGMCFEDMEMAEKNYKQVKELEG